VVFATNLRVEHMVTELRRWCSRTDVARGDQVADADAARAAILFVVSSIRPAVVLTQSSILD